MRGFIALSYWQHQRAHEHLQDAHVPGIRRLPMNDKPEKSAKYKMHMALGLMFLTVFIDLIGFGIIIPVLPLYAKEFGADGFTIGLLVMSYSLMQFFFAPFW